MSSTQHPAQETQPPPGVRATRLHQVFNQALTHTLRANNYANFSGCFPTPARHVPASLESLWRQLNAKLEESARGEFEDIVAEREAIAKLNELDELVGEAKGRLDDGDGRDGNGEVAPHTLSPDQLYQAHLTPYLTQVEKVVSERIEDTKSQNEVLAKDVLAQRAEIRDLIAGLESVVGDLRGAAKAAEKFEKENDLHQENIQMDEEVRARPV